MAGGHRCTLPGGRKLTAACPGVRARCPLPGRNKVCRGEIGDTLRRQLINVDEIFGKIPREGFDHTTAGAGSLPQIRHVTARGPSPCAPLPPPRPSTTATIEHLTTLGERQEAKRDRADQQQEPDRGSPGGAALPHRTMTPDCPMSPGEQDSPDLICKWAGCGLSFETLDDLVSHLTAAHVTSQHGAFFCFWHGCSRTKGFNARRQRTALPPLDAGGDRNADTRPMRVIRCGSDADVGERRC